MIDNKKDALIDKLRRIKGYWEPIYQDKQFIRGIVRGSIVIMIIVGMFVTASVLAPTHPATTMLKEIQQPVGAIHLSSSGFRKAKWWFYEYPGMSEQEVRQFFKKELLSKGWRYGKQNERGDDIYIYNKYRFLLQKSVEGEKWRLQIAIMERVS